MPILSIAKKEEEVEHEITSNYFSIAELMNYNQLLTYEKQEHESESLPFILRRIILEGVIPIYDNDISYETRIILNRSVKGIDINSKVLQTFLAMFNVKESKINSKFINKEKLDEYILDNIIKIIPSETPINVIGLIIPHNLINNIVIHKNLFPLNKDNLFFNIYDIFSDNITHNREKNDVIIDKISRLFTFGVNPPNNPLIFKELLEFDKLVLDNSKNKLLSIIPNNNNIFKPIYAKKIENSINDSLELLNSEISHFERNSNIVTNELSINLVKKEFNSLVYLMKPILLDELMINFYNKINMSIPYVEYEIVPIATLIMNNEFEDYINFYLGNDKVRDRIAETKYKYKDVIKDYILLGKYSFAYKTLYGESEFNKLKIRNNTVVAFFESIPEDRKDKIESEVQRLDDFWKILNSNKCEHRSVIKKLDKAITQDDYKSIFAELISYLKSNKEAENFEGFCSCKLCNLRLICPHKFISMDYIINNKSFDQIKKNFIPFIDNDSKFKTSVICKICNEELFKKEINESGEHVPIILAEHRNALWKDANYLIHNYVKFPEAIFDRTALIRNMINKCYNLIITAVDNLPFGSHIEKWRSIYADKVFTAYLINLEKITQGELKFNITLFLNNIAISQKTTTKRAIDEYRKILSDIELGKIIKLNDNENYIYNTSIYVLSALVLDMNIYAFCDKYILKNKQKNTKNKFFVCDDLPKITNYVDKKILGGNNDKNNEYDIMLDEISENIFYGGGIDTKENHLNYLTNKSSYNDNLKQNLTIISKKNKFLDIINSDKVKTDYITINKNENLDSIPLYNYAISNIKKENANEEIILKSPDSYSKMKIVKFTNNIIPKAHRLIIQQKNISGGELEERFIKINKSEYIIENEIKNVLVKREFINENKQLKVLRKEQLINIYNILVNYCKSNIWADKGNIDNPYDSSISDKKLVESIRTIDKTNEIHRQKILRKAIGRLPDSNSYSFTKIFPKYNIRELYAPDGSKIKWDKLIYGTEIVDLKEGSLNKYGKLPDDKYSSKWKLYLKEEIQKDDEDLRKLIEANHIAESLIIYYFNICPEGGQHQRENSNDKCKKCGIYIDMNKEDLTNFVIKYKTKYENSKTNIQKGMDIKETKMQSTGNKKDNIDKNEFTKWENVDLDRETIKMMEKIFYYPDAIWKYLGQCYGIKYDDLVSFKVIPSPITNMYNPAIFTLDSYINSFFVFRKTKGYEDKNFKLYKELYKNKRNIIIRDEELLSKQSQILIDWMRAFFYKSILIYLNEDEENIINFIKNIAYKDTLLCKNDLLYGAVIISDEQDFIGADELEVQLTTVEEGEVSNPVFSEELE
jgi:hypothetical protein